MEKVIQSARSSGSLNLSDRNLSEVPNEIYKPLDALGEADKWWEAVDLQKLILAHNNLEVLKEDLKNLSSLVVLNISHNKLSSLPAAVGELPLLKSLDVSFNQITSIPEEIGSASSLVKVDLSNNLLCELPVTLSRCLDLSELKASNNKISNIPDELACCSKLNKLDLEGNKLTELPNHVLASWPMLLELNAARNLLTSIPENIGVLSKLIRLDLHQNRISSMPPSIKGCYSLAELYMRMNLLSSLPEEIGELPNLATLDLNTNQLREFPAGACKLKLAVLDLSNNSLGGLPPELGRMTTLRKLLLTGNPIRTIRSTLVSGSTAALLKFLRSRLPSDEEEERTLAKDEQVAAARRLSLSSKELNLSGMGLTTVPPTAWEADDIVKLDLSSNSLEELPNELGVISSLQGLILSRNKIKKWPGSLLSSFHNLSCLKIDNNPLSEITHTDLEGVPKLEILDLSCNTLSLPDPSVVSKLPQLQELYLRRMKLQEFPTSVVGLLQLRILDLSQNSIMTVPAEIKNLTVLCELNLSDNNISTVPPELGLLENTLQVLKLEGNPIRSIRRTILDRGTKAILKYLKEKLPDQQT